MSGNPNGVRRPDRRRARHEATRLEILDAAWSAAQRDGLAGLSLRDIAAAVGMTAPSLYTYFSSKNDIYDAMFRQGYDAFAEHMDAHTPATDEPRTLATALADAFVDFARRDAARFQLLFLRTVPGFEPSAESWAVALDAYRRSAGVLVERGAVDEAGLDLWTAVVTGLASQQLANDPHGTRWSDLIPRAVEALVLEAATRGRTP